MIKIGNLDDVSRDDELLNTVLDLLKNAGIITYAPRDGQYAEAYGAVVNVTLADGRTATILVSGRLMAEINYRQAKERLSAPDADLSSLRAELAVLMDAIDNNHFPYDPERPFCRGFVLWTHPDDPKKQVTIRNGQITCVDGAHYGISAKTLWIRETSEQEQYARLDIGGVESDDKAIEFNFSEVLAGLEDIIGCKVTTKVCYGYDGFYQLGFERQFKRWDRQRLRAEQVISFMQKYDCAFGRTYVEVKTGRIDLTIQLHKGEHGNYTKKG